MPTNCYLAVVYAIVYAGATSAGLERDTAGRNKIVAVTETLDKQDLLNQKLGETFGSECSVELVSVLPEKAKLIYDKSRGNHKYVFY